MGQTLAELVVRISGDTASLSAALGRADKQVSGFHGTVNKLSSAMGTALKVGALAGAGAMGAFGIAAVKGAADFEETMTRSVSLAGLLPQEVDKVTDALLKMAPAMGKSPQELAEAFYFASSAGLDTAKALAAVTWSAKAAAAGLGETKTIVDAVTSIMNAYSLSADQAGRVTDTLVATVKEGKGEPEDLAGALGKVIPVASQMGVSFEEVGASLAVMTRIGLDAEESATALRGIMVALLTPSVQATAAFTAMGTSADEIRKAIKDRGLAAVLVEMMDALGGNEEALVAIFPEVRALTGVLATASNQSEEYRRVLQSITGALGITDKAFAEASDTFSFKMSQLRASFDVLRVQVGNYLLPMLKEFADWFVIRLPDIQRFIDEGIKNLQKALQDNRQTLVDAAAGMTAMGKAMFEFGSWVISNKVALVTALMAIGTALIFASGPVGIVAGLLSIAAAYGVIKKSADGAATSVVEFNNLGFPKVRIEEPYDLNKWLASEKARQEAARITGAIMSTLEKEAQRQALARFRALERGSEATAELKKGVGDLNIELGGGTVAALTAAQQALLDLCNALTAAGVTNEQFIQGMIANMNAAAWLTDAAIALDMSLEDLVDVWNRSGLAGTEFGERIAALHDLEYLRDQAKDATDAMNGLYDSFNQLFAKPTVEGAAWKSALDQLKLERAKLVRAAGKDVSESEQKAIDKVDAQIDAIEREIDVRRAEEEVMRNGIIARDATKLTDEALRWAVQALTDQMGPASQAAADLNTQLFWSTLRLIDFTTWLGNLQDAMKAAPSFQHGGIMPYTGMAHLGAGERVIPANRQLTAGNSRSQIFYGPVTVQVPSGASSLAEELERMLR